MRPVVLDRGAADALHVETRLPLLIRRRIADPSVDDTLVRTVDHALSTAVTHDNVGVYRGFMGLGQLRAGAAVRSRLVEHVAMLRR